MDKWLAAKMPWLSRMRQKALERAKEGQKVPSLTMAVFAAVVLASALGFVLVFQVPGYVKEALDPNPEFDYSWEDLGAHTKELMAHYDLSYEESRAIETAIAVVSQSSVNKTYRVFKEGKDRPPTPNEILAGIQLRFWGMTLPEVVREAQWICEFSLAEPCRNGGKEVIRGGRFSEGKVGTLVGGPEAVEPVNLLDE